MTTTTMPEPFWQAVLDTPFSNTYAGYRTWLLFLIGIMFLTIASPFNTSAWAEEMPKQESCRIPNIPLLLYDIHEFEREKSGALTLNKTTMKDIDMAVDAITNKYILVGCDVVDLMIELADAGFKLTRTQLHDPYVGFNELILRQTKSHYFFATIVLKNKWYEIFSPSFEVLITHEAGRIKSVNAIFVYLYP